LKDAIAFEKALINLRKNLDKRFGRAFFFISSRITDWSVPGIQDAMRKHLLDQQNNALAVDVGAEDFVTDTVSVLPASVTPIEMRVFSLDPLSYEDAKRMADIYGAMPVDEFWQQVEKEGGCPFYKRPQTGQIVLARGRRKRIARRRRSPIACVREETARKPRATKPKRQKKA
jgi:hypothetical protein